MKKSRSTDSVMSEPSSDSDKSSYQLYNENNIYVKKSDIQNILRIGGVTDKIRDLKIYQQAFTNTSYSKNMKKKYLDKYVSTSDEESDIDISRIIPIQPKSNETLEWLGDSILQGVAGFYLYKRFKQQDEGFLTKTRSKLVKKESLSYLANCLEMNRFILMSKHVEVMNNGRKSARILEDTFEAFIGAIMLDFSNKVDEAYAYKMCSKFIVTVIEKFVDLIEVITKDDNYKDQLMRYFQKKFNGLFPKYDLSDVVTVQNPNGTTTRKFTMIVKDTDGNQIGIGTARSKKEAQQMAAKKALKHFGLINGF
jgi:ribonuclease-3